MITKYSLNRNAVIYLLSDFMWNFARTVPHAILTIFLLDSGVTIQKIAILQIAYMVAVMTLEFPSGVLSDKWSRKKVYLLSMFLILASYIIICLFYTNFVMLLIAWVLYGSSVAFRSGTLDSAVVLELRDNEESVKGFSAVETYVDSISSIVGAFTGSILYPLIHNKMYFLSIGLFVASIFIGLLFNEKRTINLASEEIVEDTIIREVQKSFHMFFNNNRLRLIILLFCTVPFFTQTLYQFWQVIYKYENVPIKYYGYVYVILQICNIVGTALYNKIKLTNTKIAIILIGIPTLFLLIALNSRNIIFFMLFPMIVILFYAYSQYLTVFMREHSPSNLISTFTSLIGTLTNIMSIMVLLTFGMLSKFLNIVIIYAVLFSIFSIASLLLIRFQLYIEKKAIED